MFLPSLLEYSKNSLQNKIYLLNNKRVEILDFLGVRKYVIHLDLISPQFAEKTGNRSSVNYKDACDIVFRLENLECLTIHLMYTEVELEILKSDIVKTFTFYQVDTVIYVPEKTFVSYQIAFQSLKHVKVGIWYDVDSWPRSLPYIEHCLLMTVKAGSSGQKLSDSLFDKALKYAINYPETVFLLDGGWKVDNKIYPENVYIVSYTSFWKKINSLT